GFAFMCYEIVLIQKWTLFLGYPTYALTVTLAALLVSAGLGSLATERWGQRRDAMLPALLGALVVFTFFHGFGLGPLAGRLFAQPLGVRIAAAVLTMAPCGFCLGTFMPLGLRTVARLESAADGSAGGAADGHYVAWAWAVNGFFSVIGSLLATMASMTWGFRAVLVGALVVYLVAATVLRSMRLQQS